MTSGQPPSRDNEEFWHDFLTRGSSRELQSRRIFKRIPQGPRCAVCAAPFAGIGAPLMRLLGKRPSDQSPKLCMSCFSFLASHHGGAEIELSLLFADIRGSTAIAERTSPAEFHGLLDRFYATATKVVIDHDGGVDKFVGDELVALFYPLLTGERHAARAVDAAVALLRATGHGEAGGPWAPVGAGVHTGTAWVGAVGTGAQTELTAVGDAVNTAARLASAAREGGVLVTTDAAMAAGLGADLPRRSLELKGKELPTEVVTLTVDR